MSRVSSEPAPPAAGKPTALHIVLFGMPAAGKSSLLGALSEAAQTQEHLLNGHLSDPSHGLQDLQRQLYEGRGGPTTEEVVPYPVRFEPSRGDEGLSSPADAVLVDCDGRVANDLLSRKEWDDDDPETGLAAEVIGADALVLVMDASAAPAQVEADFVEFGRFLALLEENRGRRSDVGGLPVFLVLTKCDLLARPDDTTAAWMERIEERKHEVQQALAAFLARQAAGPLPFGRVDLHIWATAVKRPALVGTPERPREPYGVAELFRQSLEYAQRYRQRQRHAGRRLFWTVAVAGGMVAVLTLMILALVSGLAGSKNNPLQARMPPREPRAAVRLRGPMERLVALERELADLKDDPRFGSLPRGDQEYIDSLMKEVDLYVHYWTNLKQLPLPEDQGSQKALEDLERSLSELVVPAEYRQEWAETEAVKDRDDRLRDVKALRAALENENDARQPLGWYWQLKKEGRELELAPAGVVADEWAVWQDKVTALLARAEAPPFRPSAKLPGSQTVTYDTVLHFPAVVLAKRDWEEQIRPRLERLRDLCTALGLAGPPASARAPLDVPRPSAFTVADARALRKRLEEQYPDYKDRLTLTGLPEEGTVGIRRAAQGRYDHLIEAAQPVVLEHLRDAEPGNRETPERWRKLIPWLAAPQDLADWRILARVLGRLSNPEAEDPLAALADFVRRDSFDLDLTDVTLEIPDAVRVRPVGRLEIFHPPTNERGPAVVMELTGERRPGDGSRRVTQYTFRAQGKGRLTYRPGETLRADLAVRDAANRDMVLTWSDGRSVVYQFEYLTREPLLHLPNQSYTSDDRARGVLLQFPQGRGLPAVPDLLPTVRIIGR